MLVLEDAPVIVPEHDEGVECEYLECHERAKWSALWSCGESIAYCDAHLAWAKAQTGIACACSETTTRTITIVMVVPL